MGWGECLSAALTAARDYEQLVGLRASAPDPAAKLIGVMVMSSAGFGGDGRIIR